MQNTLRFLFLKSPPIVVFVFLVSFFLCLNFLIYSISEQLRMLEVPVKIITGSPNGSQLPCVDHHLRGDGRTRDGFCLLLVYLGDGCIIHSTYI